MSPSDLEPPRRWGRAVALVGAVCLLVGIVIGGSDRSYRSDHRPADSPSGSLPRTPQTVPTAEPAGRSVAAPAPVSTRPAGRPTATMTVTRTVTVHTTLLARAAGD